VNGQIHPFPILVAVAAAGPPSAADDRILDPERAMADDPTAGGSFPKDRYRNPETALGGADAVEKTTYVTGKGTEPEAVKPVGATAGGVPAGGGKNATWVIIGLLLLAAVLVYLLGFGR
jgi:hypothetical protein